MTGRSVVGAAWAVGAVKPLTCQSDNIGTDNVSPSCSASPSGGNASYWGRVACEVEVNAMNFIRELGAKYKRLAALPGSRLPKWYDAAPVELVGLNHVLEFTVTLPDHKAEETAGIWRKAWKRFNDKFLRVHPVLGEWLRVMETHKRGALHAHIMIESRLPVGQESARWKRVDGKVRVDGRSVPPWLVFFWEELRGSKDKPGVLQRYGFGYRHTLQPIKKDGKSVGKYFAKYIRKGIRDKRPEHLKSVRMREYSSRFPRAARAMCPVFERVKCEHTGEMVERRLKVKYWSEKHKEMKVRTVTRPGFDVQSFSKRRRRKDMAKVSRQLGFEEISEWGETFGKRWAYYANPVIALEPCNVAELMEGEPWELVAKARAMARYSSLVPLYALRDPSTDTVKQVTQAEFDFIEDFSLKRSENWAFLGFRVGENPKIIDFAQAFEETFFESEYHWERLEKQRVKVRSWRSRPEPVEVEQARQPEEYQTEWDIGKAVGYV